MEPVTLTPDQDGALRCQDWRNRGESGSLWKAAAHIFIMRPDRIIVGEVRGAEALDMLQAMNTGHPGSLSTGHSNSARDMLNRLETMVLMGADCRWRRSEARSLRLWIFWFIWDGWETEAERYFPLWR